MPQRVYAIGTPVNASERRAIAFFDANLPASYLIFHNLELPSESGFPYEFDLIIIGEFAIYVIEVKGFQGNIKGNAREWQLDTGEIRTNPLPLNNQKSRVVKSLLKQHGLDDKRVWVDSLVVLTDERAQIALRDPQKNRILKLAETVDYMTNPANLAVHATPFTTDVVRAIEEAIWVNFKPLARQDRIGDFRILETIKKRPFYNLLLAENELLHKRFSLKVYSLNVYASDETRQREQRRIMRDAIALEEIAGHPNIVSAKLPFYWESNKLVLPFEWVDGFSLRGLLDEGRRFSPAEAVDIIRQAGQGLIHAHRHGVIHRDVRPENIIIDTHGGVKLVNFDCAHIRDQPTIASRVEQRLDERFAAPEVYVNPRNVTAASDQYSLGIVFFELLTGRVPYASVSEVLRAKGLPLMPTAVDVTLAGDIDQVLGRMCAIDPDERYADLNEALDDLYLVI